MKVFELHSDHFFEFHSQFTNRKKTYTQHHSVDTNFRHESVVRYTTSCVVSLLVWLVVYIFNTIHYRFNIKVVHIYFVVFVVVVSHSEMPIVVRLSLFKATKYRRKNRTKFSYIYT